MAESECPHCKEPVSHDEGDLVGQAVTLGSEGGEFGERTRREAECPHCGKQIARAEVEGAFWQKG